MGNTIHASNDGSVIVDGRQTGSRGAVTSAL